MADPSPLLPTYSSPELRSDGVKKAAGPSIDDLIERSIGSSGTVQILQAFLISMAWMFDAQQSFINVFTDRDPAWRCTDPDDAACSAAKSPCGLPAGSWSWSQPDYTSIVSDWGLQCASPALLGMPASAYFLGCLVGGFMLGNLADSWLGRKKMLIFSCLTMSVAAALAGLSPDIWVYSGLRFICGVGRATVGTTSLVLSTEIVGRKWRGEVSNFGYLSFTLGFISLPGIAYLVRGSSWRDLYLWTSILSLSYTILISFTISESPRWLIIRGHKDAAVGTLRNIATSNGNVINWSFPNLLMVEESGSDDVNLLKILWRKKWALRRLASGMMVCFGAGIVYYGMPLNLGNLSSNLYISVLLNALSELPTCLILFFLIGRLDRRASIVGFTTLSAVSSAACIFLQDDTLMMVAEVVSFFSACTAFEVFLIYCIELFPTSIRNSAISMVRQALVLGGIFAPTLVAAGRTQRFLSFGVFGLMVGCCGLFAAFLPETRGRGISDTMEEEEYKILSADPVLR